MESNATVSTPAKSWLSSWLVQAVSGSLLVFVFLTASSKPTPSKSSTAPHPQKSSSQCWAALVNTQNVVSLQSWLQNSLCSLIGQHIQPIWLTFSTTSQTPPIIKTSPPSDAVMYGSKMRVLLC